MFMRLVKMENACGSFLVYRGGTQKPDLYLIGVAVVVGANDNA